jgi:hypothetical protein
MADAKPPVPNVATGNVFLDDLLRRVKLMETKLGLDKPSKPTGQDAPKGGSSTGKAQTF